MIAVGERVTEAEAHVLLLGREVLPVREQAVLSWLLSRPDRMSIALADECGYDWTSKAFRELKDRWQAYGLLTYGYSKTYNACLPQATEFAALVMGMDPVEWIVYTCAGAEVVDLDAHAEDYDLAAGEPA
ncbi:hypothetical protein [Nocardia takedensis]|uniref:hypothetical protein n=1 Tax=Nocardia takedensis TaxID=259390 RepID=UPI0012F69780|nr:hypothetical protein [Nocardia takedensis]